MMYSETVLSYLHNAIAKPLWRDDAPHVFSAEIGAQTTGAWLKYYLCIENNTVQDVRYRVLGSGYLIATAQWASEFLSGNTLATAQSLTAKLIIEALHLPEARFYCAHMVVDAVEQIVRQVQ